MCLNVWEMCQNKAIDKVMHNVTGNDMHDGMDSVPGNISAQGRG